MKTFQQLQEEIRLVEAPTKGVVFMFGRFNPPTSGHEKMVKRAVQVARRAGVREVRLYPSFSQDPKKNPLPHREKVKWLSKFFKGVKIINNTDARTPFAAARQISDQGFKRVIMVAGGDRVKEFQSQISKYIKHRDPDKSFEFDEFQVVSAGERDPDAEDASGMSASKLRALAAAGDFDNFSKGLPSRANQSDASGLFDAIRRSMNLKESMSAEESDAMFIDQLKSLKGPDIAEDGKCYSVVWADGRGIAAYRNRRDAVRFIESGDRDVVSVDYRDAIRQSGRSLVVRNRFTPDRSSIGEEWPDDFEMHDELLFRINEDFEQLDEGGIPGFPGIDKWWYNTRTRKVVEVDKVFHMQQVVAEPIKFGLSRNDINNLATFGQRILSKISGGDLVPKLEKLLKQQGWVQITWARRIKEATIRTPDNKSAQKTLNWFLDKINPSPNAISIDIGTSSVELKGSQIDTFAKKGRVVRVSPLAAFRDHVELDEKIRNLDKWWYDTKKRKAVEVVADFHDLQVVRDPGKFGLSMDFLLRTLKLRPAELEAEVIPVLEDHLFGKGWTHVTWSRNIEELSIRGDSKADVMKALNWFLDTGKTPATFFARGLSGGFKLPGGLTGNQIQQFAKTGRVVTSRVAAFR